MSDQQPRRPRRYNTLQSQAVLRMMEQLNRPVFGRQIEHLTGIDADTVYNAVDRFVEDGLARPVAVPGLTGNDARRQYYELTDDGHGLAQKAIEAYEARQAQVQVAQFELGL